MTRPPSILTARDMLARGFEPVPMLPRAKRERDRDWRAVRVTEENVEDLFDDPELNIAIKLGPSWGNLVDVDLDNNRAIRHADRLLPTTGMVWGRDSRPRTHRVYRLNRFLPWRRWMGVRARCIMELRSDTQCVNVPGSVHPRGEMVRYEPGLDGEPSLVDADELAALLEQVAVAVRLEYGEGPYGGVYHAEPIGGSYARS